MQHADTAYWYRHTVRAVITPAVPVKSSALAVHGNQHFTSAAQCSAVQCSAVPCTTHCTISTISTVQYSAVQCSTVQCSTNFKVD